MNPVVIGECQLWLGDCREILPSLPKVDAVVTDPIYDRVDDYRWLEKEVPLSQEGNGLAFTNAKHLARAIRRMETELPVLAYTNANGAGMNGKVITKSHYLVWWGSGHLRGYMPDGWLSSAWEAPDRNEHPWTKNPRYYALLLSAFSAEGDLILDPFMGSGTTGVACVNLGRKFIGIEIEPKYFAIACRRIEDAVKQGRLPFVERPKAEQLRIP